MILRRIAPLLLAAALLSFPAARAQNSGPAERLQTLRSAEPMTWRLVKDTLTLESMHLVGEGSDLRGSGSLDLGTAGTLKLSATGNLNLGAFAVLDRRLRAEGFSTVNLTVGGTRQQPLLGGRLEVAPGPARMGVLGGIETGDRPAENLLGRVSEQVLGGGIPRGDPAVGIQHDDRQVAHRFGLQAGQVGLEEPFAPRGGIESTRIGGTGL